MTLSVPAATDRLVALATTATTGMTVNGEPVAVEDGWPDAMSFGMFVVGVASPPPDIAGETTGTRMWSQLGAQRVEEDYTIPCYIDVRVGGTTQKTVRDLACGIFDAFWPLLKADLTLGGVLSQGRLAEVIDLQFIPSNIGTPAEPARRQVITFQVHCRNITT